MDIDDVSRTVRQSGKAFQSATNDAADNLQYYGRRVIKKGKALHSSLSDIACERPLLTIGVAALAGWLLASLFRNK